jgi:hypothetical protein
MAKKVRRRTKAVKKAQPKVLKAFVSDQSSVFGSVVVGTNTVITSLQLPPGSWVIFATVALAPTGGVLGTTVVQARFALNGVPFSQEVQTDFTVTTSGNFVAGFMVFPLNSGVVLNQQKTLQVMCTATQPNIVSSQPTTITAIQVPSLTHVTA